MSVRLQDRVAVITGAGSGIGLASARRLAAEGALVVAVDIDEAARQLELAIHDARVAFDCIALGDVDRAHTHALTARVAVDAAVTALVAELAESGQTPGT